ncbi:hypothetical protein NG701_02375 [Pseudarthrobacter sp. HLT3-5]|uniref:hypothetical protein n=1 Tax=Pseudarthrobacter cellobiosi TaxID=2953654 RepID=UPI00208F580D|nr:hypothetical protein [Pseudarthrobacter sp. HLT3-5]MCO4273283.1 hypothetical protein [Pseudarthrobacter sp. HLT3-5]
MAQFSTVTMAQFSTVTDKKQASDPKDLKNDILMLATKDIDEELEPWENSSGLDCGVSDAKWTVTFAEPEIDYGPLEGQEKKGTPPSRRRPTISCPAPTEKFCGRTWTGSWSWGEIPRARNGGSISGVEPP